MQIINSFFHTSQSIALKVTSASGFHLRPAAKFATEAKQFNAEIYIEFSQKRVSAKAVNAILSLNLDTNDSFTLHAKGKDAKKALEILGDTFESLMNTDTAPVQIEKQDFSYEGHAEHGEIIYDGIAVGELHHFHSKEIEGSTQHTFEEAVGKSVAELEAFYANSQKNSDAHIYLAQKALLLSVAEGADSLQSFSEHIEKETEALKEGRHASKAADLHDLLNRVKTHLGYRFEVSLPRSPFILVADDLLPSQIKMLENSTVLGVALSNSTLTSHTAILLRASGIPSLLLDKPLHASEGKVILDAYSGVMVMEPTRKDFIQAFKQRIRDERSQEDIYEKRFEPAVTPDGTQVKVFANVSDPDSARAAKAEGAEGIGLLRSEFLFKEHKPELREQIYAYKAIFDLFDDVTVRTLDVGGDKALPYIDLPEEKNPFLGIRGVRLIQTHPELLAQQLEAIFIAAEERPVKVMFPMISTPKEFTEAKSFALEVAHQKDIVINNIQFGIMIEVPSVLFAIPQFNQIVDFYSLGTNDLSQYLFAVERTHSTLKIDTLSPILFNAIEKIAQGTDKPLSICGELAGDQRATKKLVEMGIRTLSLSANNIAKIKDKIRNV